jgi:hypothetical protein
VSCQCNSGSKRSVPDTRPMRSPTSPLYTYPSLIPGLSRAVSVVPTGNGGACTLSSEIAAAIRAHPFLRVALAGDLSLVLPSADELEWGAASGQPVAVFLGNGSSFPPIHTSGGFGVNVAKIEPKSGFSQNQVGFSGLISYEGVAGPWVKQTILHSVLGWPPDCEFPTYYCINYVEEAIKVQKGGRTSTSGTALAVHTQPSGGQWSPFPGSGGQLQGRYDMQKLAGQTFDIQGTVLNLQKLAKKDCAICKALVTTHVWLEDGCEEPGPHLGMGIDFVLLHQVVLGNCLCESKDGHSSMRIGSGKRQLEYWYSWQWDICGTPQCESFVPPPPPPREPEPTRPPGPTPEPPPPPPPKTPGDVTPPIPPTPPVPRGPQGEAPDVPRGFGLVPMPPRWFP